MHTVSLGVAQHIGGNVLFELIWHRVPRGQHKEKLAEVWAGILEFYKLFAVSTRVSKLTLSMFTDKDRPHQVYPQLTTKAKETEWLCRALARVWPQYQDMDQQADRHIGRLLELLVHVYDLAGSTGLFHSHQDSAALLTKVQEMQAHYNWLAKAAEGRGEKRWNTVLKHHYMGHWAEDAQWLHCRAGATYLDEDFMGRMKTVAMKCTGGVALYRLGVIVLAKYRRGMFLRWSSRKAIGELLG
jgi:hypothetical protein